MTHYDHLKIFYHSVQIGGHFTSSLENMIYNSLIISDDDPRACILRIFSRPVFEIVIDESNMKENSNMIYKRAVQDKQDYDSQFLSSVRFFPSLPLFLCSRLSVWCVLDFIHLANHWHTKLGRM